MICDCSPLSCTSADKMCVLYLGEQYAWRSVCTFTVIILVLFFPRAVNKFPLYVGGEKTVGVDCCTCVFAFPE